jgi:hypothetical protein
MEYNTEREPMLLMEYGRSIQRLAAYVATLENEEDRTGYAHTLINMMKQLNPAVKEISVDNPQRIWDHLHLMAGFQLNIDGPFPAPSAEELNKRPQPMPYPKADVKYKNYGKNIELLVAKAMEIEDEQERLSAFVSIGRLVKSFYSSWHNDSIDDAVIIEHLREMSGGAVDLTEIWEDSNQTIFNSGGANRTTHPHHLEEMRRAPLQFSNAKPKQQRGNNRKRFIHYRKK